MRPCPQVRQDVQKAARQLKTDGDHAGPQRFETALVLLCGLFIMVFRPLDKVLEISRKKHQFDVQKKSTKTTAEVPFSCGSELFADLTGQPLSDHFMHDTFEKVGAYACLEDVIPSKEEIAERCQEVNEDSWRPVLVVASDGAHVPTRAKANAMKKEAKGRWQEAKGFRIYLLGKDRIVHVASWHQIQNEEQFGKDLSLWHLASHKIIFVLDYWVTEPTGCGNI